MTKTLFSMEPKLIVSGFVFMPILVAGTVYLIHHSNHSSFMLELRSPFIIPDLFTGRVLEAQSFCYAESALVNSCQDLVSQDNPAAPLYIVEQSIWSRRIQTFFDPRRPKLFQGGQNVLKYSALQLARVSLYSCNPFDFD